MQPKKSSEPEKTTEAHLRHPVSTAPSPKARPVDLSDLNRLTYTAVVYWSGILFGAGCLIFLLLARGPDHPAFGLTFGGWTLAVGPALVWPSMRFLPPSWFRVPAGERVLHRILGVWIFGWLLERSGWNRSAVYPTWGFSITRARLPFRALAARAGGGAHAACFTIHTLLAAVALFAGHPWGALWILLPGVVVHLYPVLLQRAIMLRLQPLSDKHVERAVGQRGSPC